MYHAIKLVYQLFFHHRTDSSLQLNSINTLLLGISRRTWSNRLSWNRWITGISIIVYISFIFVKIFLRNYITSIALLPLSHFLLSTFHPPSPCSILHHTLCIFTLACTFIFHFSTAFIPFATIITSIFSPYFIFTSSVKSNRSGFKGRPGTDGFYGSHGSSVSSYKINHAVYFITCSMVNCN